MQFVFPAPAGLLAQAAAAPTDLSARQMLTDLLTRLQGNERIVMLCLVLAQVVVLLAFWLSSKPFAAFAEGRTGLGSAFKVYFLYLLTGLLALAVALASVIILPMAVATFRTSHGVGPAVTILGFSVLALVVGLVTLYAIVAIPMKRYRLPIGTAFLYLFVTGLLAWLGLLGLGKVMGHPLEPKFAAVREWWHQNEAGAKPLIASGNLLPVGEEGQYAALEKKAADRSKSIEERHTALKELYDRLALMRVGLKAGDATARAEYERRKAKYESLLNELRAEVAARGGA